MRRCTAVAACSLLFPLLALGVPAAVSGQQIGFGYVANAPELLAGGGVYVLTPFLGGLGVYVDAKFDTSSRTDDDGFDGTLTARQVDDEIGDEYLDDDTSWRTFNAALVRPVNDALMLYGGVGYATGTAFRQYYDDTQTRGLAGNYWVEAPGDDVTQLNYLAGMFLRLTPRLQAQFGVETAPRGGTVGVSYLLR